MKALINKAERFAEKFESKIGKVIAFWGALGALVAAFPSIIAFIYGLYIFGTHLYNLDTYVTEFKAMEEYQNFQIMQITHMVEAEADPKESFGIPVRMTNPPVGHKLGDLWYFTKIQINGVWLDVTYGAFPSVTKKKVGILDMHGEYKIAGEEIKPIP